MSIIQVKKITKKFKDLTAVNRVSFEVEKGEIFGFLGPNGAGKSTTINILATILKPTSGEAKVNGFSVISDQPNVRKSIGMVFQDPSLDDRLTAEENLRFHARLYDVPKADYQKRMKEVLDLVDLWDRRNNVVKNFSGGMKRRLEIARSLIHYPAVLFLDEPTIGLDPQTRNRLWEYILKLKEEKGITIFMTTHYMNEAEYCNRIAIIDHGKIVALDTPDKLKKSIGKDIITIKSSNLANLETELKAKYRSSIKKEGETILMEVSDGENFLPKFLHETKTKIDSISLRKPTLDDVFLHLTGRKIREEEASDREKMKMRMRGRRH